MKEKTSVPSSQETAKKKKIYFILGTVGSFALLFFFLRMSIKPPTKIQKEEVQKTTILTAGGTISAKDSWIAVGEKEIQALTDKVDSLNKNIDQYKEANQELKQKLNSVISGNTKIKLDDNELPSVLVSPTDNETKTKKSKETSSVNKHKKSTSLVKASFNAKDVVNKDATFPPALPPMPSSDSGNAMIPPVSFNVRTGGFSKKPISIKIVTGTIPDLASENAKNSLAHIKTVENYIPAGSFTQGVILGGIDAPTGSTGKSDPLPVLIRLTKNTILPNEWRRQATGCLVIGAGYGDMASERAYIRTESLSCVLKSGQVEEEKIKGYIVDESGRNGVRGRLVSKQGQLLANAFLAGLGSGLGNTLSQTQSTQSISPLGSTSTFNSNQALHAGLYGGIGNAFNKIADFYLKLADETFPIVEVPAGRTITVVLTDGVKVDVPVRNVNLLSSDIAGQGTNHLAKDEPPNY